MKKSLSALIIGSCFLFACGNSNDSKGTESTTPTDPAVQNAAPAPNQAPDNSGMTAAPNPAAAPTDVNPPHGQPGHRHDETAPPAGGMGTAPAMAAPVATAPGMNPPHGQPGHDCAVAVGAPLKK